MVVMVSSKVSSRSREREGFRRPSDREDIDYRGRGQLGLIIVVLGPFSLLYVPSTLFVPGDATATVDNIRASESLFRIAIVNVSNIVGLVSLLLGGRPS